MSRPSILQSAVRRARAAAPIAGAALLLGLTGAAASATPAGAAGAAGSPGAQPSVVLTVPTALHHGYRHGAVPRETRDVSGVEALGYALQVPGHQSARAASKLVRYGGGLTAGDLTAAGVTTGPPQVYLVFMGDQWGTESTSGGQVHFSGDPDAFAPALQTLYAGLGTGGEQWSGTMTQYCDGAAFGATVCSEGDTQIPYPTGGVLAGIWYDNSASGPNSATAQETAGLTGHQLAAEAEAAASYFAYHDDTHDGSIDGGGAVGGPIVAFTNLPYVPDAGADCGAGTVTSPGTLDGATEAASHEYAETITDQFPEGNPVPGWINTGGEEVGDLCAYVSTGPGAMFDLALGDGNVVVQGIWSNKDGGCSDGEANYTYTPTLAKFGPASGTAGSSVTVTGTNLGTATSVLFGGVPGSVTSDTPGAVTATVPVGAVSGPVTVDTTFGDVTSTTAFHVAPSITSFAPTVTTRGATLAITGSGLSAAKKVVVGGKKAVITSDSATQIDVTVGPKAVSGSVSVTTKYGTASLAGLTIS